MGGWVRGLQVPTGQSPALEDLQILRSVWLRNIQVCSQLFILGAPLHISYFPRHHWSHTSQVLFPRMQWLRNGWDQEDVQIDDLLTCLSNVWKLVKSFCSVDEVDALRWQWSTGFSWPRPARSRANLSFETVTTNLLSARLTPVNKITPEKEGK